MSGSSANADGRAGLDGEELTFYRTCAGPRLRPWRRGTIRMKSGSFQRPGRLHVDGVL
jgi:hypothetical protein